MPRDIGGTVRELLAVAKGAVGDDGALAHHKFGQRRQALLDDLGQPEKALRGNAVVVSARLELDDAEPHWNKALADEPEGSVSVVQRVLAGNVPEKAGGIHFDAPAILPYRAKLAGKVFPALFAAREKMTNHSEAPSHGVNIIKRLAQEYLTHRAPASALP